jgi:hypothetical protein
MLHEAYMSQGSVSVCSPNSTVKDATELEIIPIRYQRVQAAIGPSPSKDLSRSQALKNGS